MKRSLLSAATVALGMLTICGAALADPALGKVETVYVEMSQNLLVELTPQTRILDRPLVADVRLRDGSGQAARRVFLRLDGEKVETGDVVAVYEGERGVATRLAPLRSRDRLAHIEAKYDTTFARNFFQQKPSFLALVKAD